MPGALEGVRVLDLSSYLAGPYGCALLGDMGAEVIKVEAPGGDFMRQYPSTLAGTNRAVLGANRNKRSIVLDLKTEGGGEVLRRMIGGADVVVHNFRPGVPEKLGIDHTALTRIKPDVISCALTGYGQVGPMRRHPGFDQMLQCFAGLAAAQGETRGGEPEVLRGSIVDFFTSSLLAFGVAAALVHRLRTGEGQEVDVSLLRSAIALQPGRFIWAQNEARDVQREPDAGRVAGARATKEGRLYLQAATPAFWTALCEVLGLDHLLTDPRYDTGRKRFQLAHEIQPQIEAALMNRTALEWEALMLDRVPAVAVRPIYDMFDHPQVLAAGLVTEHDHPVIGRFRTMTTAVGMGVSDVETTRAPEVGEHSDAILAGFGYSQADIAGLRGAGAVA